MRIFVGKGYRIYFVVRDLEVIVLLCGGDKSSQQKDIEKAKPQWGTIHALIHTLGFHIKL